VIASLQTEDRVTNMEDRLPFLRTVPLFQGLPDEALRRVDASLQTRTFVKGDRLFFENDPGHTMYVLREGYIKISKISADGREKTLAILRPPDFFGEMAILNNETRSATAEAMGEVTVYVMYRDDFMPLLQAHPEMAFNMIYTLSNRLREIDNEVQMLSFQSAQGRVAHVLLRLYRTGPYEERDGVRVIAMTHQEVANLVGASRETVTRVLRELEDQKILRCLTREIHVLNLDSLEALLLTTPR
jgi:CRP-like cAMP-binding protein